MSAEPAAAPAPPPPPAVPRPRLCDHLRVLLLFVATIAGVVPFVLHVLAAPFATPLARRRMRRLLERAASPAGAPDPSDVGPATDAAAWAGKTVFVVAGEPSGDRLAARVVREMRAQAPGVRVRGYGGPALVEAGARLDREIVEHAVVGFTAVVASLPYWWRLCAQSLAIFRETPPDLVLTVDFPGLNLRLARWARRRGIRVVHLVAPQTWAWAPWRTGRLRRAVDRLLVTFPFEQAVFEDAGVPTAYVGHPLFEAPLPPPRTGAAPRLPGPRLELRPGSRRRDVRRQAPIVLDAAERVAARFPGARLAVRIASPRAAAAFEAARAGRPAIPGLELAGAGEDGPVDLALTTSGTSTAELAAALVPMVVFYRVSPLGRLGKALLVTSPYIAMANLLAGRDAVPERLVGRGGGAALADALAALLSDPARWAAVRAELEGVRARLARPGVAARAAREILAP